MKNLICMLLMSSLTVLSFSNCSDSKNTAADPAPSVQVTPQTAPKAAPQNTAQTTKMPWVGLGEVEALLQKNPKKIIVDVYTPWCGPCKMMDRNTFSNPEIIDQMGTNFYPIKFNAEGPDAITFMGKEYGNPNFNPNKRGRNSKHQLAGFFAVRGYPSLVVLNEEFQVLGKIVGYRTPEQLKGELEQYMN